MSSLTNYNKAAVAAANNGEHQQALSLFDELIFQLRSKHLTHPDLHVIYSNRAACHLALQQHQQALADAQQCVSTLLSVVRHAGLPLSRHPYWPKACQRLGDALAGLGHHQQAAAAFEAGLCSDPTSPALKAGLQAAQQGAVNDILAGKALNHRALPAPVAAQLIACTPHSSSHRSLQLCQQHILCLPGLSSTQSTAPENQQLLSAGQMYHIGWGDAAASVASLVDVTAADGVGQTRRGGGALLLPTQLLTPRSVQQDDALKDVYDFVRVKCDTRAPKQYIHRELPDLPRLTAWSAATAQAVHAVQASGRSPRVLLLGAKAGLLAIAAVRAGAVHVTCVEPCIYLAQACHDILLANGVPPQAFCVTSTHPTSLKLGGDLATTCNILIADLVDDAVLSGGFIPAVAHALDELLVRDDPVVVPAAVTVRAQAVALRSSRCEVAVEDGDEGDEVLLDVSALDQYRWTASQVLPAPLDTSCLLPLSAPLEVWHLPAVALSADTSAVKQLEVTLSADGAWCGVVVWAELQLFCNISLSTAGPWGYYSQLHGTASSHSSHTCSSGTWGGSYCCQSYQPGVCWLEGRVAVAAGDTYPLVACHNTVRLSFGLQEADYQELFSPEPSFPHAHFAMVTDHKRLSAYYKAMKVAMAKAAARKLQQMQDGGLQQTAGSAGLETMAASRSAGHEVASGVKASHQDESIRVNVLDMGCGTGVLSCLAVAAAGAVNGCAGSTAKDTTCTREAGQQQHCSTIKAHIASGNQHSADQHCAASSLTSAMTTREAATAATSSAQGGVDYRTRAQSHPALAAASAAAAAPVEAAVVGVELVGPLAAVAVRTAARNGCSAAVSVIHGDAAKLERGLQVPAQGLDLVVFDLFDSGLIGHQVLFMIEMVKAKLLVQGGQVLPAGASIYAMGLEMQYIPEAASQPAPGCPSKPQTAAASPSSAAGGACGCCPKQSQQAVQHPELDLDLSALDQFRWSGEAETVSLDGLPHKRLTRPAKVFDFDFCQQLAPSSTCSSSLLYPTEAAVALEVVAVGQLNAVVLWFDLHLEAGVALTSAPAGISTGGRMMLEEACSSTAAPDAAHHTRHSAPQQHPAPTPNTPASAPAAAYPLHPEAEHDACIGMLQQQCHSRHAEHHPQPPHTSHSLSSSVDCWDLVMHPTANQESNSHDKAPLKAAMTNAACNDSQEHQEKEEQWREGCQPRANHWGHSLHYLDHTAAVAPGDEVLLAVTRQGPTVTLQLLGGTAGKYGKHKAGMASPSQGSDGGSTVSCTVDHAGASDAAAACNATAPEGATFSTAAVESCTPQQTSRAELPNATVVVAAAAATAGSIGSAVQPAAQCSCSPLCLAPAPFPPWLNPGVGIEDPHVWAVKKCQQLQAQMLQRAPGGKFPPIFKDLALMQIHAGTLLLPTPTLAALTQELCMQEALAVAAHKQVQVSAATPAEAAGIQPPVVWR